MSAFEVYVNTDSPRALTEGVNAPLKGTVRGESCVVDFYTEMALEGNAFQVRAGSISTPIVGDVVLTDTAAEMCFDCPNGVSGIPVYFAVAINLGTGTLHEYALKSVAAASSSGTAVTPLPLKLGGMGCRSTARAQTAGAVTVAAEVVTTTRALWHMANPKAVGAGHELTTHVYEPLLPHVIEGRGCCYAQIAATGTGPSYFASLDFIELTTKQIS